MGEACLMSELRIPPEIVAMNLAANGEAGREWLASLPRLVTELSERWSLTVGAPYTGGHVALTLRARRADGTLAVLKLTYVDVETRYEGDALRVWGGEGAVQLLAEDGALGALVLERLEPGVPLLEHPDRDEAISVACALLRRLWRPVGAGHPFKPVVELAEELAHELPRRYQARGQPFERRLLDRAVALCAWLAEPAGEPVLANRDFHLGNVLSATREPWLAIDPKPLAGEPAFDTGHLARSLLPDEQERPGVHRLLDRLADELELDVARIRAWAFVRSIDNALWELETGGSDADWDLQCARLLQEQ